MSVAGNKVFDKNHNVNVSKTAKGRGMMDKSEESLREYHETIVTLQYDNENLKEKLLNAELTNDDLEQSKRQLTIAYKLSESTMSRLRSQLDAATEKLQQLTQEARTNKDGNQHLALNNCHQRQENDSLKKTIQRLKDDHAAKEKKWKQKATELQSELTSLSIQVVNQQVNGQRIESCDRSDSNSNRRPSGADLTTSNVQQQDYDLSNPHGFPIDCRMGPFGVPTVMENGTCMFLSKPTSIGENAWTSTVPQGPQKWLFKAYPGFHRLPRMDETQRRKYESAALEGLKVPDLKHILREHLLKIGGSKQELLDRVAHHLDVYISKSRSHEKEIDSFCDTILKRLDAKNPK